MVREEISIKSWMKAVELIPPHCHHVEAFSNRHCRDSSLTPSKTNCSKDLPVGRSMGKRVRGGWSRRIFGIRRWNFSLLPKDHRRALIDIGVDIANRVPHPFLFIIQ